MWGSISISQHNAYAGNGYNRLNDEIAAASKSQNAAKQKASDDYAAWVHHTRKESQSRKQAQDSRKLERQQQADEKIAQMKRMIRGEEKKKQYGVGSIADSIQSYSEQLKASRESAKKTATELKQLKYNFKDISGQIRRSKTSASAKQVANKARREVVLLKLKKQSGQYDEEEISAAITHAQAMERAAKKKVKHLLEEELIKITDDAPSQSNAINMEEQIEAKKDEALEQIDEEMQALEEELSEASKEEMQEMQDAMEEMTYEMLDEMGQAMEDMLEDNFSELMDSMFAVTDFEMTEDDFKELVKKHRTSEDKDMVKADMEYLKAMFDRYNRMLNGGKSDGAMSSPQSSALPTFSQPAMPVEVSIPEGGAVDVSV